MLDGKPHSYGGNAQRKAFRDKASGTPQPMAETKTTPDAGESGESTTTITHRGDGSHSVTHGDGESCDYPTTGHMLMGIHAKHSPEDAMHIERRADGGATTHHVGMDGVVEGPQDHASTEEAANHMKQVLGEDGGNGAIEMSDGADGGAPMSELY